MQQNRKKLIINYANVNPELMEAIRKKYPLGWINHTIKVPMAGGAFFFAMAEILLKEGSRQGEFASVRLHWVIRRPWPAAALFGATAACAPDC